MKSNFVLGIYDDDHTVLEAVKSLRAQGIKVYDVFSPFPIHGMDPALGLKESRLPTVAFICGAVGTVTALALQIGTMTIEWPIIIGDKPFLPIPSFIPVTFELTVLFAALGMVAAYLFRNQLKPGIQKDIAHIRQTDDRFILAVECDLKNDAQVDKVKEALVKSGALEFRMKELDTMYELRDDFKSPAASAHHH